MKIRKINDNTIRCIITQEDLEQNHIDLDDLLEHKPQAMDYLRSIVMQAAREENFSVEGQFTTMQVRVLPDRSICLTLSQGLQQTLQQNIMRGLMELGEKLERDSSSRETEEVREGECISGTESVTDAETAAPQTQEDGGQTETGRSLYGFVFDSLDDVILGCQSVPAAAKLRSLLYQDEQDGSYCLVFLPEEETAERGRDLQFEKTLLTMNEYGSFMELPPESAAYIAEHRRCILPENAAEILMKM